jgi:soluble lytic murein transglycosylase-like protein
MRLRLFILLSFTTCLARALPARPLRVEAEYYVAAYARHYGVPVEFARAIVEQESAWKPCAVSVNGAVGLMQLMPETAWRLGVRDRCNVKDNISGGIRYLASLMWRFHGDLRMVAAAYYAGERAIAKRGLRYSNRDVLNYVSSVRLRFAKQRSSSAPLRSAPRRNQ